MFSTKYEIRKNVKEKYKKISANFITLFYFKKIIFLLRTKFCIIC